MLISNFVFMNLFNAVRSDLIHLCIFQERRIKIFTLTKTFYK